MDRDDSQAAVPARAGLRDYPMIHRAPVARISLWCERRRYTSDGYRLVSATGRDRGLFVDDPPPRPWGQFLSQQEAAGGVHIISIADSNWPDSPE